MGTPRKGLVALNENNYSERTPFFKEISDFIYKFVSFEELSYC